MRPLHERILTIEYGTATEVQGKILQKSGVYRQQMSSFFKILTQQFLAPVAYKTLSLYILDKKNPNQWSGDALLNYQRLAGNGH